MPHLRDFRDRSASTHHRLKHWVLLGALGSVGAAVLGGCDRSGSDADRRVFRAVDEAIPKISGAEMERGQAGNLLQQAAGETAASPTNRVYAKAIQGQNELHMGELIQPKIDATQTEINHIAWEIQRLAAQIQTSNQLAAAMARQEPSAVQAALKQNIGDVQGTAEKPDWVKSDGGAVPSLSVVTKDITDLQGKIAELQKTVQSLTEQRTAVLAKADQLTEQSTRAKGDKSVELFKQAADGRKQADDLLVQLDQVNVPLVRAQGDLAVKQGQQGVLNEAITAFNQHANNTTAGWADLQKQIAGLLQQSKDLLGEEAQSAAAVEESAGGLTIAGKGARIEALNKQNRARRDEAEQHLNSAISFFKEAGTLAEQSSAELTRLAGDPKNSGKADASAWKAQAAALPSGRFKMLEAAAEARRANLFTGRATEASARQQLARQLKPTLDAAKLPMPSTFQDSDNKVAEDLKSAREQANASYKNADELLEQVTAGIAQDLVQPAHVARIFTAYGWHLAAAAAGDTAGAKEALDKAKAERDVVVQSGIIPRNLPAELVVAMPAPGAVAPGATPPPPVPEADPATPAAPAPAPAGGA